MVFFLVFIQNIDECHVVITDISMLFHLNRALQRENAILTIVERIFMEVYGFSLTKGVDAAGDDPVRLGVYAHPE